MVTLAKAFSPANSRQLSDWLVQHTEGNPYFLTHLIQYALTNKLLTDGQLDLQALADATVLPQTIHNLILSRLSRLSEAARRVLDIAAVVGREFSFEIVVRAALLSDTAVLDALDELYRAALIYPSGGLLYTFDHSLTMEVAYREMSEARYRTLHRHVPRRMRTFTGSVSTASPVCWPSTLPVADVANKLPNSLFEPAR